MARVITGLEKLITNSSAQSALKGNVGYLCHAASITPDFVIGVQHLQKLLGPRLKKLFGPQHGFVCDVQDNMVETSDFIHPHFKLPVHSLYGETRVPTDEMLSGLDTFVVDLQDVGTRVYTYISTLKLTLEACAKKGIRVVVLDRPNPVGGDIIEGNILQPGCESFVGQSPIPMRHALTMGEYGALAILAHDIDVDYEVVPMDNWKRNMFWRECALPWVNPSPNLPTPEGSITFCGTVLFEGTNVSEGRGTTRSLEIVGAPGIEPYGWWEEIRDDFDDWNFTGLTLRPTNFMPTFQKHAGTPCGGFHIHITNADLALTWRLGQFLIYQFKKKLDAKFAWNDKLYEYESDRLAIDYINGDEKIRLWAESSGDAATLETLELNGRDKYLELRSKCLLY